MLDFLLLHCEDCEEIKSVILEPVIKSPIRWSVVCGPTGNTCCQAGERTSTWLCSTRPSHVHALLVQPWVVQSQQNMGMYDCLSICSYMVLIWRADRCALNGTSWNVSVKSVSPIIVVTNPFQEVSVLDKTVQEVLWVILLKTCCGLDWIWFLCLFFKLRVQSPAHIWIRQQHTNNQSLHVNTIYFFYVSLLTLCQGNLCSTSAFQCHSVNYVT